LTLVSTIEIPNAAGSEFDHGAFTSGARTESVDQPR